MRIEATAIFFKKSAIIHDDDCWPVEQPLVSDLSDRAAYWHHFASSVAVILLSLLGTG